jgi:hypothetical protein
VPRYFFDIRDDALTLDDEGVEFTGPDAAAKYAKKLLPEIAAHEATFGGERRAITVLIRGEDGRPIYSAALSYLGTWLYR